jgi:hypothetical protein
MSFMPAAKKQRVALGEMRVQASDGPVVRALLEKIRFDAKAWLAALAPEEVLFNGAVRAGGPGRTERGGPGG